MSHSRVFTRKEIDSLLTDAIGKTLGDVDKNHVFDKTITHPKITGIAGDVVEQSVLDMAADTRPEPDIEVDGELIELKTTGIRKSKKKNCDLFEGKEPMSITGVSVDTIVHEDFDSSRFWSKLDKVLLVYYEYASLKTVPAREYMNFPLMGYHFHEFSPEDKAILAADWQLVHDYVKRIQDLKLDEKEYAGLSHDLRGSLLYIDTAPKWPNPPRFRLKRSVVTAIVQEYFSGKKVKLEVIRALTGIEALNNACREKTLLYKGKTLEEIALEFHLPTTNEEGKPIKALGEQVIVRMMGGRSKKINKIDLFNKAGIVGKTIILSNKGGRTEDTKLFTIDFSEWLDLDMKFEDSQIYDYFANNQFLCIVFQETEDGDMLKSKFLGFKRLSFDDDFISTYARRIWEDVRHKVFNNELVETVCTRKDGSIIKNPVGTDKTAVNFPKSSDHQYLFMRGTSGDSTAKPLVINGIHMYQQQVWIRGKDIIDLLSKKEFI